MPRALILGVALWLAACGSNGGVATASQGSIPATPTENEIRGLYVEVLQQVCATARCGERPVFVIDDGLSPVVLTALATADSRVVIVGGASGLIGDDERVVDDGRVVTLGQLQAVRPGVAAIDTFWSSSRGEGFGRTHLFAWDGARWEPVAPADVGVTVTTAVP